MSLGIDDSVDERREKRWRSLEWEPLLERSKCLCYWQNSRDDRFDDRRESGSDFPADCSPSGPWRCASGKCNRDRELHKWDVLLCRRGFLFHALATLFTWLERSLTGFANFVVARQPSNALSTCRFSCVANDLTTVSSSTMRWDRSLAKDSHSIVRCVSRRMLGSACIFLIVSSTIRFPLCLSVFSLFYPSQAAVRTSITSLLGKQFLWAACREKLCVPGRLLAPHGPSSFSMREWDLAWVVNLLKDVSK